MELHAGAQLEHIFLAVCRDRPALRQAGPDLAATVDAAETLEHVRAGQLADRGGSVLRGIEHRRLERHADYQLVFGLRPEIRTEQAYGRERTGCAQQMAAMKYCHGI